MLTAYLYTCIVLRDEMCGYTTGSKNFNAYPSAEDLPSCMNGNEVGHAPESFVVSDSLHTTKYGQ